jgi:hypothetical protein
MSRRQLTFKQRDATRLLKAVAAAGLKVLRVEVGVDGRLVAITDKAMDEPDRNEWEDINGTH